MGTPDFSVPALEMLSVHPHINIKHIISMPDRKSGRGYQEKSPEVISFAKDKKIPFFQTQNINKEDDFLSKISHEDIDLIIVLAFAQFLGSKILQLPKLGCFNIHTSLLPKYRGAAPIQYALLNGDKSTGVSIQRMVKKMDAGNIVHEKEVSISDSETGGQLYTRLKFSAALALNDFIYKLISTKILDEKVQIEENATFAPTLKREDGLLNFETDSAEMLLNKIRALYPWPGTYCFLGKKRLKILSAKLATSSQAPGHVDTKYGKLIVATKDGALELLQIQLEGKKPCLGTELLRGLKADILINSKD